MLIKKSKTIELNESQWILLILEDTFLSEILDEYYIAKKQKAILSYGINQKVKRNQTIVFELEKESFERKKLEQVDIVYEDNYCLIAHKPPFLLVHEDGQEKDSLQQRIQNQTKWPHKIQCVHRIDVETSGLVLFSKFPFFQPAWDALFSSRKIKKEYLCWVQGELTRSKTISAPLGKDRHNAKKMRISNRGLKAITHVTPIKHINNQTLCRVSIETGRKHQIRVHLASIGYPIINDSLYGQIQNDKGLLLQSHALHFIHPFTRQEMHIKALEEERFKVHQ